MVCVRDIWSFHSDMNTQVRTYGDGDGSGLLRGRPGGYGPLVHGKGTGGGDHASAVRTFPASLPSRTHYRWPCKQFGEQICTPNSRKMNT